jgi:phosphoacetylglucosamine mutase
MFCLLICHVSGSGSSGPASVFLAHDTRPSAGGLVEAAKLGVEALGITPVTRGLLTTPQLHWMVRQHNRGLPCAEADYYAELAQGFADVVSGFPSSSQVRLLDVTIPCCWNCVWIG